MREMGKRVKYKSEVVKKSEVKFFSEFFCEFYLVRCDEFIPDWDEPRVKNMKKKSSQSGMRKMMSEQRKRTKQLKKQRIKMNKKHETEKCNKKVMLKGLVVSVKSIPVWDETGNNSML